MEHLNPRGARVVALEKPSERESTQWYFQRYVQHLPVAGRDRPVRPVLVQPGRRRAGDGVLDARDYLEFMRQAPELERMLVRSGIHLIKLWFSVSRSEQRTRFVIRQVDPVRQWKLSPIDLACLDKWDEYTEAKEAMFFYTDTADAPWTVVKSNDKKRARLEAMRHVLNRFPYDEQGRGDRRRPRPAHRRARRDPAGAGGGGHPPLPEALTGRCPDCLRPAYPARPAAALPWAIMA